MAGKSKRDNNRKKAQSANRRRRVSKRRGRRTLHHLLLITFVLGAGVILSLTVFFKITAIVVTGADRYLPEEVATATGIQLEDNLFKIPAAEICERLLEEFPYIETVQIHRRLPSTVEVEVTQSIPMGALAVGDEYLLINREGKVLERGLMMIPEQVPLVKGVPAGDTRPGQYLGHWEPEPKGEEETPSQKQRREARDEASKKLAQDQEDAMKMLTKLFEAIEETGFADITNVDVSNTLNMTIMYENRMLFELGTEADLAYKLIFIEDTLGKLHPDAHGLLDATSVRTKRAVYYRPAENYDSYGYHVNMDKSQEWQPGAEDADEAPPEGEEIGESDDKT